jgi:Protein of unknown function (DUF3754)
MNEASPITVAGEALPEPAFIPISRTDVLDALLSQELWPSMSQRALAANVLKKIGLLRQYKSGDMLNQLSDIYDPFNPDDETINLTEASDNERLEKRRMFNSMLKELVTSANYNELRPEELEEILTKVSPDGVQVEVDFKEYDVKLIYYRGESHLHRMQRELKTLFLRRKPLKIPIFERLFMAIKFKPEDVRIQEIMRQHDIDEEKARKMLRKLRRMLPPAFSTDHIYIKIFKNIPRYDVEMLFPNIRVKMKYTDKLQLGGSAVVGTATWAIGTASKLLVAVALSPLMLAGALVTGVGGIMYAQVRNIFITRDRYRMLLAQRLYFQNLSNNQGALALMVDEAEEEDVKEEALLYIHLLLTPLHASQIETLRGRINAFLKEKFGVEVNFDIHDAMRRLVAMGLVTQSPMGDLRALPPSEAAPYLHERWCRLSETN